jgi:hypothetical protein
MEHGCASVAERRPTYWFEWATTAGVLGRGGVAWIPSRVFASYTVAVFSAAGLHGTLPHALVLVRLSVPASSVTCTKKDVIVLLFGRLGL